MSANRNMGRGFAAQSGVRPPHLQCRNGTFHLRVRVPSDIKVRVGVLEVRRSLKVQSLPKARLLALKYAARVLEVFELARELELTKAQVGDLIRGCFADLSAVAERGFVPTSERPDLEIAEQRTAATDCASDLTDQIACGTFSDRVRHKARLALKRQGIVAADLAAPSAQDVLEGMARALLEQQRLFLHRLGDRLGAYEPEDKLFSVTPEMVPSPSHFEDRGASEHHLGDDDPTIEDLVRRFLEAKTPNWSTKTAANNAQKLSYLVQHVGAATRVSAVRTQHVRSFRDALKRLRLDHHRTPGQTFADRQTDHEADTVSPKTASLHFDMCKALFRWAVEESYLKDDPAKTLRLPIPRSKQAEKPRRPFNDKELIAIFTAPLYTGAKSAARRFEPGDHVISDAFYWVPIVGFFTGMRLAEIIQLQLSDVSLEGAVPYIDVTRERAGTVGSGEEKYLKSEAAVRKVPIHPDLIKLGFADFVRRRFKQRKGKGRLFFEVDYGADGVPSTLFSKKFGRFLDSLGLEDPALVFHSFRHLAEDAFRNAGQQQYVINKIIGHRDDAISAHYGEGVSLETSYEAVKTMKLKIDLVSILVNHRPSRM